MVRFPLIEAAAADLFARRALDRDRFDALAEDAKLAAFTVARISSLDVIDKIQTLVAEDVRDGGTLDEFADKVDALFTEGSALSPGHVETVYRTNVAAAYTRGLVATLAVPLVRDEFPYLEYTAVHDSRTRHEHREMESLGIGGSAVYRADDPIWRRFLPPWSWNCRCMVIPLSLGDAAKRGVAEARRWLESGVPPVVPAWVRNPPFSPPPGWAAVGSMPAFV